MEENEERDFSTTDAGSSVPPVMQRAPRARVLIARSRNTAM